MKFSYIEDKAKDNQTIYYSEEDLSFTCEKWNHSDFSIMTGCAYIGIDINLRDKEILQISGCCPKEIWIEKELKIPQVTIEGKIYLETKEKLVAGAVKYLTEKRIPIYYDRIQNIICIGNTTIHKNNINVKMSSNLIVSLVDKQIESIWIIPLKIK